MIIMKKLKNCITQLHKYVTSLRKATKNLEDYEKPLINEVIYGNENINDNVQNLELSKKTLKPNRKELKRMKRELKKKEKVLRNKKH